jgi:hypothetical protein
MQRDPTGQPTRDLILEAAFLSVAEASLDDLLSFMGPTSLARAASEMIETDQRLGVRSPAPETVAYHFHTPDTERQFDLGQLADELIDQACAQTIEAATDARQTYLDAGERFAETRNFDAVITAIDGDLAHYRPGSADPLVDARERVYFTAIALCDVGSSIARKLQQTSERSVESAVPIYERFLELTGRRLVDGFDTRQLATLVAMLLEGQSLRARYRGELPVEKIAAAVIRIFWAFSVRCDSEEPDIHADLTADTQSA